MTTLCLITGASGFIGSELSRAMNSSKYSNLNLVPRCAVRSKNLCLNKDLDYVVVPEVSAATDWQSALLNVDVVVHLAGRAHIVDDKKIDSLEIFREVNVKGSINLAKQAVEAGVARFIFFSSIGVNGNETFGNAFRESDEPNPKEPYAVSKLEAEIALCKIFSKSNTQLVIIRPPLVYGLNAPGNFGALVRLIKYAIPLPFGAIHNLRSLVSLANIVDFTITCVVNPRAANQIFLVSDGSDISSSNLMRQISKSVGVPSRLVSMPVWALKAIARLLGKSDIAKRICGNLQIDISKARNLLGWTPKLPSDNNI